MHSRGGTTHENKPEEWLKYELPPLTVGSVFQCENPIPLWRERTCGIRGGEIKPAKQDDDDQ